MGHGMANGIARPKTCYTRSPLCKHCTRPKPSDVVSLALQVVLDALVVHKCRTEGSSRALSRKSKSVGVFGTRYVMKVYFALPFQQGRSGSIFGFDIALGAVEYVFFLNPRSLSCDSRVYYSSPCRCGVLRTSVPMDWYHVSIARWPRHEQMTCFASYACMCTLQREFAGAGWSREACIQSASNQSELARASLKLVQNAMHV